MATTIDCAPKLFEIFNNKSSLNKEELIKILSAHSDKATFASKKLLIPPPRVTGTKQFLVISFAVSIRSLMHFCFLDMFKIINSSIKCEIF